MESAEQKEYAEVDRTSVSFLKSGKPRHLNPGESKERQI